jgi:hypothetical protein
MRDDLNNPDLEFLSYNIQEVTPYTATVNAGMAASAAADSKHSHSDYTDGLTLFDSAHYDADSMVLLGQNAYEYYLTL